MHSKNLINFWRKEYEQKGIPSSYRTNPSSAISEFFYPYFLKYSSSNINKHVVDIGCGLGRNAIFFAEKKFDVAAIDIVPENINHLQEYSKNHNLKIKALCQDVTEDLPIQDKSADIVIDIFCYKHQINNSKKNFYRIELQRILKDDGYYGPLLKDKSNQIIDPHTNIKSILFDPEDIKKEFSEFKIEEFQTSRKPGLMHGTEYQRVMHAFIMKRAC